MKIRRQQTTQGLATMITYISNAIKEVIQVRMLNLIEQFENLLVYHNFA